MIDYDPETGCDDGYDGMIKWVIDQVIEAINDKRCTNNTWVEVFELIEQKDVESAYKEYLEECKTP